MCSGHGVFVCSGYRDVFGTHNISMRISSTEFLQRMRREDAIFFFEMQGTVYAAGVDITRWHKALPH